MTRTISGTFRLNSRWISMSVSIASSTDMVGYFRIETIGVLERLFGRFRIDQHGHVRREL